MKRVIIILLLTFVCLSLSSQTTEGYDQRIVDGKLSYSECMVLINSGDVDLALPSLYNLLDKYKKDTAYIEDYLKIVISLDNYYNNIGDIASSHQLLDSAQELIHSLKYYINTPNNRVFKVLQGREQMALHSYADALSYYLLAQMECNEVNDKSGFYIDLLCQISEGYQNINDLLMATIYIEEAKELYEEKYGNIYEDKGNIDKLQVYILRVYGRLHFMMNNWDEAEKIYAYIINIHQDYGIEDTESLLIAYNNLSQTLIAQHRYDESLKFLSRVNSHNNEVDFIVSQNMSIIHLLMGNNREAVSYLKTFNSAAKQNVVSVFSNYSGMDIESYWNKYAVEMITLNNLVAYKTQDPEAIIEAYNNMLFCKNLLLGTSKVLKERVSKAKDPQINRRYEEYITLRDSLSYKTNDNNLKGEIAYKLARKEEEILRSIGGAEKLIQGSISSWNDVLTMLDENEVAIEFSFIVTKESLIDDKGYYGAFILRKDFTAPKLVLLGGIDNIDELIGKIDQDILSINDFYSSGSQKLYRLTWKEIEPYLADCSTIYYSTTGELANINFDIVQDDKGKNLNDKYKLIKVSSTNKIADIKLSNKQTFTSSVLYGDIKYNESLAEMAKESERYTKYSNSPIVEELALRTISDRGNWNDLDATKFEVSTIKKILIDKKVNTLTFTGIAACEESFKSLSGNSPDIIHLATHGYYISSNEKATVNSFINHLTPYSEKEKYLQWAGLLMAGANNAWNGNFDLENTEDGILTADEISRLDLSKTKLVMLSACETARGYVDPVNGIYGLQQAFKKAGVETIVMSLWKVPDEATSLLMSNFYDMLVDGVERHEALKKAMFEVRKLFKDPYYWAGFIMLD